MQYKSSVIYGIPAAAMICALVFALTACGGQPPSRPNILLFYADDLGYGDLSCYGGDIPTPHIDRIAGAGMRFTDFYVSAPACTPSRYSLLTGCYPQRSRHGLVNVYMPGDDYHFDTCEVLLPELLKEEGFSTGIVGKWHMGKASPSYLPAHHGFDYFSGFSGGCIDFFYHQYSTIGHDWYVDNEKTVEEGYSTELIGDHSLDFIRKYGGGDAPFFLYVPFNAPHYGKTDPDSVPVGTVVLSEGTYQGHEIMNTLQAPPHIQQRFAHIDDPYRRMYAAMVSSMDDQVGRILDELESHGLIGNTMIWFISDNGGYSERYYGHADNGPLRGEKGTLWEGGIRIPAMVRWDGMIDPGRVVAQPMCNTDVLPTITSLLGFGDRVAALPVDGIDISGVLLEGASVDRAIFWKYRGRSAMRHGPWKMRNAQELYNLSEDLGEQHDLAAIHPEKLRELNALYEKIESGITDYACP